MIYFLPACQSIRSCELCMEEMELEPKQRRSFCENCGKLVAYADDQTVIHKAKPSREEVKSKAEAQGVKIETSLKRLLTQSLNE